MKTEKEMLGERVKKLRKEIKKSGVEVGFYVKKIDEVIKNLNWENGDVFPQYNFYEEEFEKFEKNKKKNDKYKSDELYKSFISKIENGKQKIGGYANAFAIYFTEELQKMYIGQIKEKKEELKIFLKNELGIGKQDNIQQDSTLLEYERYEKIIDGNKFLVYEFGWPILIGLSVELYNLPKEIEKKINTRASVRVKESIEEMNRLASVASVTYIDKQYFEDLDYEYVNENERSKELKKKYEQRMKVSNDLAKLLIKVFEESGYVIRNEDGSSSSFNCQYPLYGEGTISKVQKYDDYIYNPGLLFINESIKYKNAFERMLNDITEYALFRLKFFMREP